MDIGLCRLRRIGLNALHSALHPRHGLTWTDGRCIYLAPINIIDDEVGNSAPMKLGEFDHVSSLHWSYETGESHCYLCVVHTSFVSLWKVDGSFPKLSFKQIRKIHATPILQGCLWNPKRDVLCIMSKDQCTFYFKHLNKRGSYSLPPIESGKMTCGCWSSEGNKLVVGIKSIILVYQWADIDLSLNDYAIIAWRIPNVQGSICTLAALSDSRIVCSAEVRLDELCKTSRNLFEMPDLTPESGTDWSFTDEEDVIKPKSTTPSGTSFTESLLHLKAQPRNPSNECSKLVLFELGADRLEPVKLHSVNLSGILSPDLLYTDTFRNLVITGSNCQSKLLVYKVLDNEFHLIQTMMLSADERPKGICGVPIHLHTSQDGVLVMIGKAQPSDPAFLPLTLDLEYTMKMHFKAIVSDQDETESSASTASCVQEGSHREDRSGTFSADSGIPSPRLFDDLSCSKGTRRSVGGCTPTSESGTALGRMRTLTGGQFPLSRVGSSPGLASSTIGPLEERLRGLHFKSPSAQLPNGVDPALRSPLMSISSCLPSAASKSKAIEVVGGESAPAEELEIERLDFVKQQPSFNNAPSIERLKEEGFARKPDRDQSDPVTGDTRELFKMASVQALDGGRRSPGVRSSASSLDTSREDTSPHGSEACHKCQGHKGACADVSRQLSLMEKQLASQEIHISDLQKRVTEISRILDETKGSGRAAFKPVSRPDIVYLKYAPGDGSCVAVTKAFILDDGRLQLKSVKEAFDLYSVEVVVDGVPCVIGADAQGYMPVEFQPRDTVTIGGKKIQTSPKQGPVTLNSVRSTIRELNPAIFNGDVVGGQRGPDRAVQPDVTANHQAVTAVKHTPASSTYC